MKKSLKITNESLNTGKYTAGNYDHIQVQRTKDVLIKNDVFRPGSGGIRL